MSHQVSLPIHKFFSISRPRFTLCLAATASIYLLLNHLFESREFYTLTQRIPPVLSVPEGPPQIQPLRVGLSPPRGPKPTPEQSRLPCQSFGGLEDIFLVMRTGASEALAKLPVHFDTTLRCLPQNSYGIWSDLEEIIDGYHIADALVEVSPGVIDQHPDFDYYKRLKADGRTAFSAAEIAEWASAPNSGTGRDTPGWKLDKWKFLPVAKSSYQRRPDAKWFIFTECDGYINWTSLLSWLSHHDPSTPYVGQLMVIGDVAFAYGGASFIVSNAAMRAVTERYVADVDTYEDYTGNHWAGDCVLGKALRDVGVGFTQAWPTFYGDSPFDMDYNSSVTGPDAHLWCYHAMTWHHLSPSGIQELSAFEEAWNMKHSKLLRHADVFRHFLMPKLSAQVDNWDNLSSEEEASGSLWECREICERRSSCVQFAFHHHTRICKTSDIVKLGQRQEQQDEASSEKHVTSGWIMGRVEAFALEMDASCHGDGWVSI